MSTGTYRNISVERLSSPEQLDQLLRVTDTKGWLILGAFAVVIVTATIWGFLGSLPQNVAGTGMLVRSGGVFEIIAPSSGRVTDIAVSVGDLVTEGQVVGRTAQPEVAEKLLEARAVLAAMRAEHAQIVARGVKDIALQRELLARQRSRIAQVIAAAEQSAIWRRERAAIQERLVKEGLLTRQTLLATREQLDASTQQANEGRSQLAELAVKELEVQSTVAEEARVSRTKLDAQERAVAELERSLARDGEIVAQHTGRILEVLTEHGAVVNKGDAVLRLDLMGRTVKDLEAVIYVPSIHGKQIKVGMPVYVSPSTVRREEYGMMLARVTYVSEFPATGQGLVRMLKNDQLVQTLAGTDAPYEIRADLVVDESTFSKYRWSSSRGPSVSIQGGTMATAQITVATQRPINLVLPLMREYLGL